MTDAVTIANRYIETWNEPDPARRLTLIADGWAENANYIDPLMRGEGHSEIAGLITAVQERFPGHAFALIGQPDGHADRVRFSWRLGAQNGSSVAQGTDFAVLDKSGRLLSVTGFLDQVAA